METKKVNRTIMFSTKYISISGLVISLILVLMILSFEISNDSKEFVLHSRTVWRVIISFVLFFTVYLLLMLIERKNYTYYVDDGKLIFISSKGKIIEFALDSINKIYISKSIKYKGISIIQKKPKKKLAFIVDKDLDFISLLKNEVQIYKNLTSEAKVNIMIKSYEDIFILNLCSLFFIVMNIFNMGILRSILVLWICIIISLVCLIGLLLILIMMIKIIVKKSKNYSIIS